VSTVSSRGSGPTAAPERFFSVCSHSPPMVRPPKRPAPNGAADPDLGRIRSLDSGVPVEGADPSTRAGAKTR
jgi:hypothetical protein